MDTLAHIEKYLSLHFRWVLATLLICFTMYCLISWEFLSDRAKYKDLSLNSYYGYGFFVGRKKKKIYSTEAYMSEPGFRGMQDVTISGGFTLLKGKEKREKISPLSTFSFGNNSPQPSSSYTCLLTLRIQPARADDRPKPGSSTDS